jgi:type I restriction enzyme M protein
MKWMAKLETDICDEFEQVLNILSSRVLLIAKRYEHTLGEIEARTAKSRAAVVAALERMGYKW